MTYTHFKAGKVGPVLVAGGGGFIGLRFAELLRGAGLEVRAVRRRDSDLRRLAEARSLVEAVGPRVIVNLARPTHAADPDSDHAGHVQIAANLLTAAQAGDVRRLIHLGSSTEFGEAGSPVDDDAPLRPTTPFGVAKAEATSLVLAGDDHSGTRTTVLRPFSVFGPGDRRPHLVPTAIAAALAGRRLALARGVVRDWVFVDDVASACALALDGRADGLAVNLASGAGVPNEEVVELVAALTGRSIEIDPVAMSPRPWDAGIVGSTERARRALGWAARTGLRHGIQMTLAAGSPASAAAIA